MLVGGFSPNHGFSSLILEYSLSSGLWRPLKIEKVTDHVIPPRGIYAHSVVYHSSSRSFYIYGGMTYYLNEGKGVDISNKLYSLHYPSRTWSLLSVYSSSQPYHYQPQPYPTMMSNLMQSTPQPRLFHSAVTTRSYMLIVGGQSMLEKNDVEIRNLALMSMYIYRCNLWINIYKQSPFVEMVGEDDDIVLTAAGGATIDREGKIYLMGGLIQGNGIASGSLLRLVLPEDSCAIYSSAKSSQVCKTTLGCAHCSVYDGNGNNSTFCYSNDLEKV